MGLINKVDMVCLSPVRYGVMVNYSYFCGNDEVKLNSYIHIK